MLQKLTGKRVLIVEDNPVLAYDIDDLLVDLEVETVGPALDLTTGLQLARQNQLDAALLDVDLGGEQVWPLARELQQHQVPFAFISARCSLDTLPEQFRAYVCLEKPTPRGKIVETLHGLATSE
ncbi:response regulator [Qipengyuania marisflavi]|uniref:Response regulator n=1 Tax=Qipengyuania marisflavi TaxID=2486356 RepID=A0A5S3P0C3_9SPHN|nr:response regulator [Qipengyuania marisflavi]